MWYPLDDTSSKSNWVMIAFSELTEDFNIFDYDEENYFMDFEDAMFGWSDLFK